MNDYRLVKLQYREHLWMISIRTVKLLVRKNSLPFQKATAAGLTGARDYSVWKFAFTDDYASITPGNTNSLTAKLFCDKNPSSVSNKDNNPGTTYAIVIIIGVNQPPVD